MTDCLSWNWEALSPEELDKVLACADVGRVCELEDSEYLCRYAAEDTYSTWLLYDKILKPALDKFKALDSFHTEYFTSLVEHIVVQQLVGVQLDLEQLASHEAKLSEAIHLPANRINSDLQVREAAAAFNDAMYKAFINSMPTKFKPPKPPPKEPSKQFLKDGVTETAAYKNWKEKCEELKLAPPELTTAYKHWQVQRDELDILLTSYSNPMSIEHKETGLFCMDLNEHRRFFFYEFLKHPVLVFTDNDEPSTGGDALLGFGELGKIIGEYDEIRKELQFIESLKNVSDMEKGIYHPQLRVPGTHTGRLSGSGGFNHQNPPKSEGFLEVFIPRKNRLLVDIDVCSLEPSVLAECSRDPGLLSVYGSQASKYQDIYLMVGAPLPGIGEHFRAVGYDPENPSEEGTKRAKKEHKDLRNVCKIMHLSASYGAGAKKWHSTFKLQGFNYTLQQCQEFHATYWKLFKSVKNHEAQLQTQLDKNGGWLLDALGLPFCVAENSKKDLMNRKIQRSGHEILMVLQKVMSDVFIKEGIPYTPFCHDYHDEVIWEVPKELADKAYDLMQKSFVLLNEKIRDTDTVVTLKGSGGVIFCLSEAKVEGYKSFRRPNEKEEEDKRM